MGQQGGGRAGPVAGSAEPGGPAAETIDDLYWLLVGLGGFAFVIFAIALVRGLLPAKRDPEPGRGSQRLTRRWILGGGVVLPVSVLLVTLGATVQAMRAMPSTRSRDALVVEVLGRQWRFEVSYPHAGVTGLDELHLPVGRPALLHLTSADVIHSFWVPELGGKQDMLPEDMNLLVLEADEPGEYQARCAEFCGLDHAHMTMRVVAEPADQFESWLAAQR